MSEIFELMTYSFCSSQMTTSHNYSIARARSLLGYRPAALDAGRMTEILKSRGLPVRGAAAAARGGIRRGWSSSSAACFFALALLGLLALLLVPAWEASGGLVGKSIC